MSYLTARACCITCQRELLMRHLKRHHATCRGEEARPAAIAVRQRVVLALWQSGRSEKAIAEHLGITKGQVETILGHVLTRKRQRHLLTTGQVSRALGIDRTVVAYLIRRNALVVRRTGPAATSQYRIAWADLIAFLRDRRYWPLYSVAGMRDSALRQIASAERRSAGGRWLSIAEIAVMANCAETTARSRLSGGWLDGLEETRWGHMRWWWLPEHASLPTVPFNYSTKIRRRRKEAA